MTAVVSFDRTDLGPVDPQAPTPTPDPERAPRRPPRSRRPGRGSLSWVWIPALISVAVNAAFLIAWWAPEFGEFAGRDALLGQLWPLASKELTSGGRSVVPAQDSHLGLLAALMLATSIALPFLARSRTRAVRVILPTATVYVGALGWLVTLIQLLAGGPQAWLGFALMTGWLASAGLTVWRSRSVASADLPPGRPATGWLIPVIALLYPLPLALGRSLFTADAGNAVRSLLAADPTRRFETLTTASSVLAYLAGVAVVVVVWAVSLLIPPYARVGVPWVRARPVTIDPLVARIGIAIGCAAALLLLAFPAADAGRSQAKQWLAGDPGGDHLACASWVQQRPGRPTATLTAGGEQCRSLVAFAGYRTSGSSELDPSLDPVKAAMPDQRPITSRVVAARYGAVVVVAGTGAIDYAPDELLGVSMDTAETLWSFRCDDDGTLRLRFAGAESNPGSAGSAAAAAAAGQVTLPGESPGVVVECTNQSVRIDPATGQPTG